MPARLTPCDVRGAALYNEARPGREAQTLRQFRFSGRVAVERSFIPPAPPRPVQFRGYEHRHVPVPDGGGCLPAAQFLDLLFLVPPGWGCGLSQAGQQVAPGRRWGGGWGCGAGSTWLQTGRQLIEGGGAIFLCPAAFLTRSLLCLFAVRRGPAWSPSTTRSSRRW